MNGGNLFKQLNEELRSMDVKGEICLYGGMDALLASTAESLCDESGIEPPDWIAGIPACSHPFFVSGIENLKAIAIVESPLRFRIRKIFVMENFLSRV